MECKFHPGDETTDKCVLCYTPICSKCQSASQEMGYELVCPRCFKAIGLSQDSLFDEIDFR